MKQDALLRLAFLMHEQPGAYGLLLGAGVSTGARVKQAYEIVDELLLKLAAIAGHEGDAKAWIAENYPGGLGFDAVLEQLAGKGFERRSILRNYFEGTEAERDEESKVPSVAHKAIAELVRTGYVKLLLTTNFDQLLESALQEAGVPPDIVTTDEELGRMPLDHSKVYIVKLSGDYKGSMKSTPAELAEYTPGISVFLSRVLRDYGWVVCGWSARYDKALREAFLHGEDPVLSTFWLQREELSAEAQSIVDRRRAETVCVGSADEAFATIAEGIRNIERLAGHTSLTLAAKVATVKRWLDDVTKRTALQDLVDGEVDALLELADGGRFDPTMPLDQEKFERAMNTAGEAAQSCIVLAATLAKYDTGTNAGLVTRMIERLSRAARAGSPFPRVRGYPALLTLYSAAVVAIANKRWRVAVAATYAPLIQNLQRVGSGRAARMLGIWEHVSRFSSAVEPYWKFGYPSLSWYIPEVLEKKLRSFNDEPDQMREQTAIVEFLLALVQFYDDDRLFSVPGYMTEAARLEDNRNLPRTIRIILESGGASVVGMELLGAGFLEGSEPSLSSAVQKHEQYRKDKASWLVDL
jgi:hypothetical protein